MQFMQEKIYFSRYKNKIWLNVVNKYNVTKYKYEKGFKALKKYGIGYTIESLF